MIAANRRWMTRVLRACGDADAPARAGTHSEAGAQETLAELLSTATNHIDHHLRFLYLGQRELSAALPPRYCSEQLGSVVTG